MPERLYTMRNGRINHELNAEAWLEWYMSANRCLFQSDIPHGKIVCVFTGIDNSDADPPALYEVRKIVTKGGSWVEEEAWTLRTQQEAKAVFDQKYEAAQAA